MRKGALIALADEEVMASLDGNVVFFGVPAEEFVDIEFKNSLMKEGKIAYGGGKCELIRIGALEDIDITVGHHTDPAAGVRIGNGHNNGFVNKTVRYLGKASHAAGSPEKALTRWRRQSWPCMRSTCSGKASAMRTPYGFTDSSPAAEPR